MPQKSFRVARSRTGLGLFATEEIKKGKFVVEYSGPIITTKQAEAIEDHKSNRYLFEINSRWTINGATRRNIGRYANHSCRPNAEAKDWRGGIAIFSKKRIQPGEEIVYSYGKDYLESFIPRCLCPKCLEKRREERRLKAAKKKRAAKRKKTARAKAAKKRSARKR